MYEAAQDLETGRHATLPVPSSAEEWFRLQERRPVTLFLFRLKTPQAGYTAAVTCRSVCASSISRS